MTLQQQPVITKCPPGYAWGYTPTGSTELMDGIDNDFQTVINAYSITDRTINLTRRFHGTK